MLSPKPNRALDEYIKFMDQKEELEQAKKFYEDTHIIGDEEDDLYKQQGKQERSLDDILLETGVNKDDFVLIKEGSRKRYLRDYKIRYVKIAVTEGYTFKEIGRNISVSAEAANQMSKSIIKRGE